MRPFKIFLFVLAGIFLNITRSNAQFSTLSDFSYAIGGGGMYYNGDLSDDSFLPPLEVVNFFGSADISMLLVDRLDLSLRYMHGKVNGDDALSGDPTRKARNQSFYSNIDEASLLLRARLFSVRKQKRVNPYGMFGLGYFWFKPKADLDGKSYELQPLGTEGQFITEGSYPTPYDLHSASLTYGIGCFIRLSEQFQLRLEASPQLTFTDFLDDTSTNYPDSAALANTVNGAIAVLFSSRRPKGFPDEGKGRGNPERNDVIVAVGFSVVYTPILKQRYKPLKPGVINKVFKGKRGWWGDSPD